MVVLALLAGCGGEQKKPLDRGESGTQPLAPIPYLVRFPPDLPPELASLLPGAEGTVWTHHLVREDLQALYGFRTEDELGFFELLITVTGVGPKVGLAIVTSRPVADPQLAIMQGDEAVLTAVSGVGKRLAGRIVLELKEKVAAAGTAGGGAGGVGAGAAESEVVAALQALGYTPGESKEAARFAVAGRGRGFHPAERHKINLTVVKQAEANIERARTKDSLRAFVKLTTIVDSERRFDSDPPLIVPIEEMATERQLLTVPHDF